MWFNLINAISMMEHKHYDQCDQCAAKWSVWSMWSVRCKAISVTNVLQNDQCDQCDQCDATWSVRCKAISVTNVLQQLIRSIRCLTCRAHKLQGLLSNTRRVSMLQTKEIFTYSTTHQHLGQEQNYSLPMAPLPLSFSCSQYKQSTNSVQL